METYKLEAGCGSMFGNVAKEAKELAKIHGVVEFDFNGKTCLVNKDTNIDWLYRDYHTSWTTDWKTIGPNCVENYDETTLSLIDKLTKEAEERAAIRAEEERKEQEAKVAALNAKIEGVEMSFIGKGVWSASRTNNTHGYGKAILDYAERWAKLMQVAIAEEFKQGTIREDIIPKIASSTSHEADLEGITGFMYGAAVSTLSQSWIYGKELSDWHNKKHNYEGEGTVNPAVLTIETE